MSLSPERRSALLAARAAVLARTHLAVDVPAGDWQEYGDGGAATALDGRAVIHPPEERAVSLGGALAWAARHGASRLDLLVAGSDAETTAAGPALGVLARRASCFEPAPRVWRVDGTDVAEVTAAPVEPVAVPAPSTAEAVLLIEQAGLDVVVEEGTVIGELRGLEVARVVIDDSGTARLEVGVGRFDREAFALLHGELSPPEALARVVQQVGAHRHPGAEPHAIGRLARERWLRHQLLVDPTLAGARDLRPVESARARGGLTETHTAAALGARVDGSPVVVVTTVGIDLDAVPDAADTRLRHAPDADLVIVMPPRDAHRVTRDLAARLRRPAELRTVAGEWRD